MIKEKVEKVEKIIENLILNINQVAAIWHMRQGCEMVIWGCGRYCGCWVTGVRPCDNWRECDRLVQEGGNMKEKLKPKTRNGSEALHSLVSYSTYLSNRLWAKNKPLMVTPNSPSLNSLWTDQAGSPLRPVSCMPWVAVTLRGRVL